MNTAVYFILFMLFSLIGWLIEVFQLYKHEGRFINRGFLMGPYCPIYGYGSITMVILLQKYLDDPIVLFVMAMVICSILEYFTSYFMEKLFKARWWDYSNNKYNINGRICLETMIPFGLLGLVVMYLLYPFLNDVVNLLPDTMIIILASLLFVLYFVDTIFSLWAINKIKIWELAKQIDVTEDFDEQVKKLISDFSKKGERLVRMFPKLKISNKIKEFRKDNINKH